MKYRDLLKESFDYVSQVNLIHRVMIRLQREESCLFPQGKYISEEDLNQRLPINREVFVYTDWTPLRDELESLVIQYVDNPTLLEAQLVRYLQPFDFTAGAVFPNDTHSEYDFVTAATLRNLSDYYSYNLDVYASDARADLVDYLTKQKINPITDELLNGFQQDLAQLHRLLSSMSFVASIIQGLLFEVSAPFSLRSLQKACNVTLTDTLFAWKMAPLMEWTTDYCRKMMGNRITIDLDRESIDAIPASGEETVSDDVELEETRRLIRKEPITEDNICTLCEILKNDFTKRSEDGSWVFYGPATLFAYMGYKMSVACELRQIPWKPLLRVIQVKGDSNYLKGRASEYKRTQKYPPHYSVIDDAIKQVFK